MKPTLRAIPAVETVLQALGNTGLPRPLVVQAVRARLAAARARQPTPDPASLVAELRRELDRVRRSRLEPVINATGVLVHTNLGRAPLCPAAVEALAAVAAQYCNLELDLEAGGRGDRAGYVERVLARLCQAEAAAVVNNCAAALVLLLRHFTAGKRNEVLISRGELVQIGGGFRIPDVLESSGARLREVGTTNQTTVTDYARAISPRTALILRVHRSNFFLGGFVASPALAELAALARRRRLPLVEDLGSGAVFATERFGLDHEPTPAESLRQGADLVCFSGDKLLGGPQAGIVAGRARRVAALKREPLFRALRCDKLILAALQATAEAWLNATATPAALAAGPTAHPLLAQLQADAVELEARATRLARAWTGLPLRAQAGSGRGRVGGGTLPRSDFASVTVDLAPTGMAVAELAARLRTGAPPVIGYVSGGRLKLDLRTVFPAQDALIEAAVRAALSHA
jgi:L-seryl-tRNA(Ser) seleniumtransferase